MSSESSGSKANPWAWLGLLQWSLAYSDGTSPSTTTTTRLSPEDKAFLEMVMKEGILDENERMKTILKDVTTQIDAWRTSETVTQEQEETVEEILQELRDIVEQIDYARAFAAMKGLDFLLGCIQETAIIPQSTRSMCLALIATLCQHNPPVQQQLLERGSLRILSTLFFLQDNSSSDDGQYRARIMQAMSANVRSYDTAETVFCELEQSPSLLELGLTMDGTTSSTALRKRTLFFLRALVTSDAAVRIRIRRFANCIILVIDNVLLVSEQDHELVEMALELVQQVLEQRTSVDAVLTRKDHLAAKAVERVTAIRTMTGDEREYGAVELRLWESVLTLLARAVPDNDDEQQQQQEQSTEQEESSAAHPLLLEQ